MKYITIGILLIFMSACAHKIDIQQGNVLTKEMLEQLHVGMNELQVQSLLGSPLVMDAFHKNRWDYVYSMKLGDSKEFQYSYITLFFKERLLNEIKVHAEPVAEKDLITPALVSAGRS